MIKSTPVPAPPGLVSWWPGENNADDFVDANHGVLQNGATFAAGKVGQAFSFDGVDDIVTVDTPSIKGLFDAASKVSFDFWFLPQAFTDISGDGHLRLLSKDYLTHDPPHYQFAVDIVTPGVKVSPGENIGGPRALFTTVYRSDAAAEPYLRAEVANVVDLDQWHHVAVTLDLAANELKLYLNGQLVASDTTPVGTYTNYDTPLTFGANKNGLSQFFNFTGLIDEIDIFNRILAQSEIQAIFDAGSAGKQLVALVDTDGDGVLDNVDNAPNEPNPDQSDIDLDGVGDVADACPSDPTDSCDPAGSAAASIGSGGGSVVTLDGGVEIIIPPGALSGETSISITDTGSGFELSSNLGQALAVFGVDIQPGGTTFASPVTIVFAWDDSDNNDGVVDGTNVQEGNLLITKDNIAITARCKFEPGCDTVGNAFTFEVNGLSVFTLATLVAPEALDDAFIVDEDNTLSVLAAAGVLANDSAVDSVALTANLVPLSGTANGTLTLSADGSFIYTPNADFNGTDSFSYKANDGLEDSDVATVTITVVPVNDTPIVSATSLSLTVDEGQTAVNSGLVSDVDSAVVTLNASTGTVTNNGDGTWSWSLTTNDGPAQSQTVTITAVDGDGGTSQVSFALTVTNVAPSVGPVTAPIDPVQVGTSIGASVSFTDPGLADTHTATWNWGDGSTSAGSFTGNIVTGSHTYLFPGVNTVVVTVIDDDDGSGTSTFEFVVAFDPAAGFATGGGWIIPGGSSSEALDSLPGIDNTSKATFDFVVKYKNGASETPSGQLQFQYRVGNFNLHSSDYDWLVITNNNWAKFQGLATIKGTPGLFPFKVDARDGDANGGTQPDRFIIKIWQTGTNPDADGNDPIYKASGDLGGGKIKIHK